MNFSSIQDFKNYWYQAVGVNKTGSTTAIDEIGQNTFTEAENVFKSYDNVMARNGKLLIVFGTGLLAVSSYNLGVQTKAA